MSNRCPPNSFPSAGVTSGQTGHYTVQPHAMQSAISSHRQEVGVSRIPGDKLPDQWNELQAAMHAYQTGQTSLAEFTAVQNRIVDATLADTKRLMDFTARSRAGQTRPEDFLVEMFDYSDEEARQLLRREAELVKIRTDNRARCSSRILSNRKSERGH